MDAVTYSDPDVIKFIGRNMVPLRVHYREQPLSTDFKVNGTPTVVTLDPDGKEHHRTVGFLPPEDFVPSVMLGIAKARFDHEEFNEAAGVLDRLLAVYPRSEAAPEAIYYQGLSRFKQTADPKALKGAYEKLQSEYPSSEWTERTSPYRLL